MRFCLYFLVWALVFLSETLNGAVTNEPFAIRGYYTTFMRMPTFGLKEWKQMIDCMKDAGANFLVLWTARMFWADGRNLTSFTL